MAIRKNNKKIYSSGVMLLFVLIFFFKPICFQYISNLSILETVYTLGKFVIVFIALSSFILNNYPNYHIDKTIKRILIFELWILFITIVLKGNVFRSFIDLITIITMVIIVINSIKENTSKSLSILKKFSIVIIIVQLLSCIFYPTGIPSDKYFNNTGNPLYFMTSSNGTTFLCIFAITIFLLTRNKQNHWKNDICIFLAIVTSFLSGSSTSLICSLLIIIMYIISSISNNKLIKNGKFLFVIYVVLMYFLLMDNSFFNNLFSLITGKTGFTGRTNIWIKAIDLIKASPIFGYGVIDEGYIKIWGGTLAAHNTILEILLQSGIIGLLLWISIILAFRKDISKISNNKIKSIFIISLFVNLISLSMESFIHSVYFFAMIALGAAMYQNEKEKMEKEVKNG